MNQIDNIIKPISSAVSVLIVDNDPNIRDLLRKILIKKFALVETVSNLIDAEALRCRCHFDLLIVDISLPDKQGLKWHQAFTYQPCRSDIIFIANQLNTELAIQALKVGAADFILKPFDLNVMLVSIDTCIKRRLMAREKLTSSRDVTLGYSNAIIGHSQPMLEVKRFIEKVAPTNAVVLIQGESGTGKELVARQLHQLSGRNGHFVAVNCGSIAPELLESELFGHLSGAFTGAKGSREGLFSFASGGTIFLDEIGEMPLKMQTALLRVLEQRTIRPVGCEKEIDIDVRIIAASNRKLFKEVEQGHFREDLYYRLNVLEIVVPPLRERIEDILELTHHFTLQLSNELGMTEVTWSYDDLQYLQQYDWPGNIRELRNMIERCLILGKPPAEYRQSILKSTQKNQSGYPLTWTLKAVEKHHIISVVEAYNGNKSAAARNLAISRKTLDRKYKEWFEPIMTE